MDSSVLLERLATMCRIRYFEEDIAGLRQQGLVAGSIHLCNGQEAIYVGTTAALDLGRDVVFPTYRGHGWAIACGAPLEQLFGELLGRQSGVNNGRGGSAYFSTPDWGMYGENSIVGAGAPIAVGAALAGRYDGSDRVAVASFGDGAINQGAVSEAMNFAASHGVPVLFIIENNHYSEMTPIADMVAIDKLYSRAAGFGIRAARLDGNDVTVVENTVAAAVGQVRSGSRPVVLEMMTHRIVGHYIGDAEHYRPAGEVERVKADEPIIRTRRALSDLGVSDTDLDRVQADCRREVDLAREAALEQPMADPATVLENLYA